MLDILRENVPNEDMPHDDLTRREIARGETLFHEGESGDCGYLIESGSIGLYSREGTEQHLRGVHYAGDFLGELALIGQGIRTTTAIAREPSVLWVVRRRDIDKRLSDSDPLIKEFLIAVLGDLRNMLLSNWDTRKSSAEGLAKAARDLNDVQSMTRALQQREFELYYQPIVRLSDYRVAGYESLIRWNRPDYGLVPPAEFIPLAESSGAIVEIGRWIVDQACSDFKKLGLNRSEAKGDIPFVSVNLSGRQLTDQTLTEVISDSISKYGLGAKQLKLEVTETELAENINAANELLLQFKLLGVTVALDDFGVGQSSLEYLHQFPADTLKLDRSFIENMQKDQTALTIVRAIASLAKELDMDTVAEGIESMDFAEKLKELGVIYGQGYAFARPMPVDDMAVYLEKHGSV